MDRYVVMHKDGKRAACAPTPGQPFEWKELDCTSCDPLPGGVMTWGTNHGALTFALMNGGKPKPVSEVLAQALETEAA